MITVLKSKIAEIRVEHASVEYEGSITIPVGLMARAGIFPYEQVHVNSKYGTGRIITYAMPGERCEMNGGAANHFKVGEIVHVLAFKQIDEGEHHKPIII
jgi:aspartate 1-decarboxylase